MLQFHLEGVHHDLDLGYVGDVEVVYHVHVAQHTVLVSEQDVQLLEILRGVPVDQAVRREQQPVIIGVVVGSVELVADYSEIWEVLGVYLLPTHAFLLENA